MEGNTPSCQLKTPGSDRGTTPAAPVAQIHLPFALEVEVAVLERFWKVLIHRVIRRRWERSDVDQRPACGSKRHVTRNQALIIFPVLERGIDPPPDQVT